MHNKPVQDLWRLFRIMAEFTEGFEGLDSIGPAVSVFGSARTKKDEVYYQLAEQTGKLLVDAGFAVITGGGGGIMEAANKGATQAKGKSIGLNIDLPMEQMPNEFQNLSLQFRYFFCRKVMFLKYARGFIVFPGGYGTMDEVYEALTLIQTMKQVVFPVVLIGKEFWGPMIDWLKNIMLKNEYINAEDLNMYQLVDDPKEAVKIITDFRDAKSYVGLQFTDGMKKH